LPSTPDTKTEAEKGKTPEVTTPTTKTSLLPPNLESYNADTAAYHMRRWLTENNNKEPIPESMRRHAAKLLKKLTDFHQAEFRRTLDKFGVAVEDPEPRPVSNSTPEMRSLNAAVDGVVRAEKGPQVPVREHWWADWPPAPTVVRPEDVFGPFELFEAFSSGIGIGRGW
jgi:hypothetical protein